MRDDSVDQIIELEPQTGGDRRLRADAQRSVEVLLEAAKAVFAESGVDAPVRDIAEKAGVGVGTLYRRFPQRADLVAAVFRHELDLCADAAPVLAAEYPPFEALAQWLQRFATFIVTKRGLAKALHSGEPAYEPLAGLFEQRLKPAFKSLLAAAVAAGEIRDDVEGDEILGAVSGLCMSAYSAPEQSRRMVAVLVDGLRYRPA